MLAARSALFLAGMLSLLLLYAAGARAQAPAGRTLTPAELQALVDRAVSKTLEQFAAKKLGSNQLAVTLVDLRDPQHPVSAGYRAQEPIYPASVVKLFYLVA